MILKSSTLLHIPPNSLRRDFFYLNKILKSSTFLILILKNYQAHHLNTVSFNDIRYGVPFTPFIVLHSFDFIVQDLPSQIE